MGRRRVVGALAGAAVLLASEPAAAGKQRLPGTSPPNPSAQNAPASGACSWGYSGADGPEAWDKICEKRFPICGAGEAQSPVDVVTADLVTDARLANIGWDIPTTSYGKYVRRVNQKPSEVDQSPIF